MELGDQAVAERNTALALERYDTAISLKPDNADFYLKRGFLLLKLEKLHEAIRDLDTVIRLEPLSTQAYITRGMMYDRMGRKNDAEADYVQACTLGDKSGCAFSSKGQDK
jgi:Flp pilus assembly protein TadD